MPLPIEARNGQTTPPLGCKEKRHWPAKAANGWKRPFEDPIPLPRGGRLVTLEDAGTYITKLRKAEHEAAEWQAAMEALILVATSGGPTMFARIGIMRALNHGKPDPAPMQRRKRAKACRSFAIRLERIRRIGLESRFCCAWQR
jgi:hypothetical protein